MTKSLHVALPLLAAALIPAAAMALAGAGTAMASPAMAIPAGTYKVDSHHTQAVFAINHMGFSTFYGVIPNATGTLVLDPANPANDQLDVILPVAGISTTNGVLDGELKDASWLDEATHHNIHFTATKVTKTGAQTAMIAGDLWMHGVKKTVVLDATFSGAGTNPMSKAYTVGFSASGMIKRSDFGVTKYLPLIGDDVKLTITAAFEKQG